MLELEIDWVVSKRGTIAHGDCAKYLIHLYLPPIRKTPLRGNVPSGAWNCQSDPRCLQPSRDIWESWLHFWPIKEKAINNTALCVSMTWRWYRWISLIAHYPYRHFGFLVHGLQSKGLAIALTDHLDNVAECTLLPWKKLFFMLVLIAFY
jgi:hypothetical protein